jgi:hypothetical protein
VAATKYKQQGNCHELAVALKITELGGAVSWPYGDGQAYDLVADFNGKISRVQVKGTCQIAKNGSTSVNLQKGSRKHSPYNLRDCDLVVAVTPLGNFVIPISALGTYRLVAWPVGVRKKPPYYEPYKEAWHLMR